jgi:membrane associated rhomboid family serine protease
MSSYGRSYQIEIDTNIPKAIKYLIIANVVCFILQHLVAGAVLRWFELVPAMVIGKLAWWQLVSYMFMHDGVLHLLFNMLVLWMFGSPVENEWGSKPFVIYYFLCGIGAGVVHMLFSHLFSTMHVPVLGASGAIYGVLLAFGLMYWDQFITLLLFFVLPVHVRVKLLMMFIVGFSLFMGLFVQDKVAHFAHLGGMLVGFIYLKFDWRWRMAGRTTGGAPPYSSSRPASAGGEKRGLAALKKWFDRRREKRRQMEVVRRRQRELHLRERVDAILDKINEVGYENLSEEEKQILRRASQSLSRENLRSQDFGAN